MKTEITHVAVCGMNFYITWKNDYEGYDQFGTKWIHKENPQCTDEKIIDICLDTYNEIKKLRKKICAHRKRKVAKHYERYRQ